MTITLTDRNSRNTTSNDTQTDGLIDRQTTTDYRAGNSRTTTSTYTLTNGQTDRQVIADNNARNFNKFDANHSCTMCQDTVLSDHGEILSLLDATLQQDHNFYLEVSHSVYQFVDDSNSCVGLNNVKIMKNYLELYLNMIKNFYTIINLNSTPLKQSILLTVKNLIEAKQKISN